MGVLLNYIKNIDLFLFVPALFLSLFGIFTLIEPGSTIYIKQIIWVAIGIIIYVLISNHADYRLLKHKKTVWFLMFVALFFLVIILFVGDIVKGAQSRFYIGGFAIQPSEFAKIVFIIVLAKFFAKRHIEIYQKRTIILSFVYTLLFVVPIAMQPDFGMAIVYLGIWATIIFVSGISKKDIALLFFVSVLFGVFLWNFVLLDYQKQRILTFFDPLQDLYGSGYNVYQAMIAVGSGGMFGKGVSGGTQSKLDFLPEYQTDFIFASFAEEWGFVGSFLMIFLFLILFSVILKYIIYSGDNFIKLFAVGVFAMIFIQTIIHIGMNIGLMPVTGLTLPFVSYGGSHILVEFISIGMLNSMKNYLTNAQKPQKVIDAMDSLTT